MHHWFFFVLLVLAIQNLADILANAPGLSPFRDLLGKVPFIGSMFSCSYCMAFWLSGAASYLLMAHCPWAALSWAHLGFGWGILWLGLHKLAQVAEHFLPSPVTTIIGS